MCRKLTLREVHIGRADVLATSYDTSPNLQDTSVSAVHALAYEVLLQGPLALGIILNSNVLQWSAVVHAF